MKVSNEQSSPRWENRAPATSNSSAPSGASTGSSKNEKVASPSTKRLISHTQAVRSTWHPRRVAQSISRPPPPLRAPAPQYPPREFAARRGGLRRPRFAKESGSSPAGARPGTRAPSWRAPRVAARRPALPCAGCGGQPRSPSRTPPRGLPGTPRRDLCSRRPCSAKPPRGLPPPGLTDAELEPLQLLARDGVLGQGGNPVLQVKGAQSLELAPQGDPVARRLPGEVVDQDHPPRLLPARRTVAYRRSVHAIPTNAPTGTSA